MKDFTGKTRIVNKIEFALLHIPAQRFSPVWEDAGMLFTGLWKNWGYLRSFLQVFP